MDSCALIFIIIAAIFAVINADSISFCQNTQRLESECATYCYAVAKPLLQMAHECHRKVQEISKLKDKLAELQQTVAVYEERISQCKLTEELATLRNLIESTRNLQQKESVAKPRDSKEKVDVEHVYPSNCLDVELGLQVRQVKVDGIKPFRVPCMGPGWMIIQRRLDDRVKFDMNWAAYRAGFGDLERSFFIGLEKLYRLTSTQRHELYIELGTFDGRTSQARYDNFRVGSEEEGYKLLELGNYIGEAGDAGDAMRHNVNAKFSTPDRDNDNLEKRNCAKEYHSGWWHSNCTESNLNGVYLNKFSANQRPSIWWETWRDRYSLKSVHMYIRPRDS